MRVYIGTKIVQAEPMDEVTFTLMIRELPDVVAVDEHGRGREGYKVVYEVGYHSWSPKETFERAYRLVTDAERRLVQ